MTGEYRVDSWLASRSQPASQRPRQKNLVKSDNYGDLTIARWTPDWTPEATWKPALSAGKSAVCQSVRPSWGVDSAEWLPKIFCCR